MAGFARRSRVRAQIGGKGTDGRQKGSDACQGKLMGELHTVLSDEGKFRRLPAVLTEDLTAGAGMRSGF